MFYIVKYKNDKQHHIIEAECDNKRRWVNAHGLDAHYEYFGLNEDIDKVFDSREIIKKSTASTKEKVKMIYPEYFL